MSKLKEDRIEELEREVTRLKEAISMSVYELKNFNDSPVMSAIRSMVINRLEEVVRPTAVEAVVEDAANAQIGRGAHNVLDALDAVERRRLAECDIEPVISRLRDLHFTINEETVGSDVFYVANVHGRKMTPWPMTRLDLIDFYNLVDPSRSTGLPR
jgi:hypothetical protein